MPAKNNQKTPKTPCTVRLDNVHLALIDELMPFYGNSRPEVVRMIIIEWFKEEYGLDRLREKKAIK